MRKTLLSYCNKKEEEFVKYYVEEYKDRAGVQVAVQNLKFKTGVYRHKYVGRNQVFT